MLPVPDRLSAFTLLLYHFIDGQLVLGKWFLLLVALLGLLLIETLSQLGAGLYVKFRGDRLLINNAHLFVTKEDLNVCLIISDQDHVIEPHFFFLPATAVLASIDKRSICHLKASDLVDRSVLRFSD